MPVGSDYPTGPGWQARSSFGGAKGVACPLAGSSLCSYLAFARKRKVGWVFPAGRGESWRKIGSYASFTLLAICNRFYVFFIF